MTIPVPRIPTAPARQAAACMCSAGRACSSFTPGHAVHLIQARLVSATPAGWVDAIVLTADAGTGDVLVRTWLDGQDVALWNGAGAAGAVTAGTPVAFHEQYHVLTVGTQRFNMLRIP